MQRLWRQVIVLLISVGFICTAILMLGSNPAKAQDDYTFGTENATKGTSTNPTERNTENAVYNTLLEGDQYTDTNFSGSSENIVVGTTGGGSFPSALNTDDATRRNYIEASSGGSPTYAIIRPNADGSSITMTTFPASPTTHYTKVNEVTKNDETSYNAGVLTGGGEKDIYGMTDPSDPGGTPNIDVKMWIWARGVTATQCSLTYGLYIGTSSYIGATPLITTTTYTNYSYTWTLNPSTSAEWTFAQLASLSTYLLGVDGNPDTHTTQVALYITFTPTASYTLDAQITYSSVASTSQTTGFQVLCQGYRNGDTESVNVQAWNYTSLAWVTKVTISAGSDTDYNFNLLGWAANCERSSGNVVLLRLVDVTGGDATQTTTYLDLLKIRRIEQGYALDVDISATSVAQYGNITLRIKGYTSAEQFNVNVWNYTSSAYDIVKLAITSLSNAWQTTIDLYDNHHRSGTTVKIQFVDTTAAASDLVQDTLYLDVAWVTRYHTNPSLSQNGCDPAIANLGTTIHFWVIYTDYDNEAPSSGYPKVHIDSTDYTMIENETDTAYWDGKKYYYDKADLSSGSHDYYFITKDANSIEVTSGTKQVSIHVSPTLTLNGVTPSTGNNGDSFTFFVTYNDADGDLPSYVKAHIDSTDYDMTKNDSEDVTPPIAYYYTKAMAAGAHTYYFKTKDVYSGEITTTTQNLNVNNIPVLSNPQRTPADPVYVTTEITFRITYTDADGDFPTAIKWREGTGTIQNLTMTEVDVGDTDVTNGKVYEKVLYLSHGNHDYDFYAMDGKTGSHVMGQGSSITVQNRAPTIDNKFVDDHEWRNTYWEYDYAYTDLDGDTVAFQLSTNASFLNINSVSGLVYGTTSDPVGWYSATVWCNDSYSGTDSDSFILYVDNREPVITNGPGSHVDQWRNQAWYYDFDFSDADGDSMVWERSGESWLTIASDGNISGTTSDTHGLYSFTVYANDSHGGSDSYAFDIHIENRAPDITNGPGAHVDEWRNTAWQYDFDGTDADTDAISWGRSGVTWLTINSGSGLLSGTTTDVPGEYSITVYANDSHSGQDTYVFTLHILNRAPTITNGPGADPNEWRNTFWTYDFNYNDADGDTIAWEKSGPAWLTIVGGTGVLSGTTTDTPGNYAFMVYANDSYGGSANYPFTLHISNRIPVIMSVGNTTQELNTYMAYHVTATDADSDSLTCELSTNASWLSVLNFWVNGTATGIGWYACTIWVNDSYGGSDSDYWEVTVWGTANQPPSFTSAPIDTAGHPVDYYYDCNASDPESDPLTFYLTSTHPNLVIDPSTGIVTGSIATAGIWWVNISVSDAEYTVWQNYTLTTTNTIPYFTSVPIENVAHPINYNYDANATDADGDILTFALVGNCTSMLTIDLATGVVSGYISLPGWWNVKISVSDSYLTVWQNFTLTASNTAPTFDSSPTEDWQHGTLYTYDANAHDDNGDSYSFGLEGNSTTFLSVIPATGVITGTPPTVGWWYVNVSVVDGHGLVAWQNYTLTGLNTAPTFTSSGITDWSHGKMYYYDANASDANFDILSWYLEGNSTAYLQINSTTGVVNGTFPVVGWWFVNISVSDSWLIVWQNFTVYTHNEAPYFTTTPVLTGTNGTAYYYNANAHDNNSDTITFTLVDSPIWLFVDESTGEVEGTCTLPGDYFIHLRIFDGYVYVWQNWTLNISEPAPPDSPSTPSSDYSGFSLLIMLGVIGLGAYVIVTRVTNRGKPAKKPKEKGKKK